MDELTYRPATRADAAAIRALIRQVRINPTGLDWRRFIVAVDAAGALVGCGQVKPHADGSWELASIAVAAPFRGRGVARGIIERLLAIHPQRPIYLTCVSPLGAFYEKFGFRQVSQPAMPPHFRRISRLANLFFRWARPGETLLVMMKE